MFVLGTETAYAQRRPVRLENAIHNATRSLSSGLERDARVAIVAMEADSARMSNYLINEMIGAFIGLRRFTVVDRNQVDRVASELLFQISGWVDDDTIQSIGRMTGAEFIITGTFKPMGDFFNFNVRIIEVRTAVIRNMHATNVRNDRVIAALLDTGADTGMGTTQGPTRAEMRERAALERRIERAGRRTTRRMVGSRDWWEILSVYYLWEGGEGSHSGVGIGIPFFSGFYRSPIPYVSFGVEGRISFLSDDTDDGILTLFSAAPTLGLVLPLSGIGRLFANGLVEVGHFRIADGSFGFFDGLGWRGLITNWASPGFDIGLEFGTFMRNGWVFNAKYRRVWYQGGKHTNAIGVGVGGRF